MIISRRENCCFLAYYAASSGNFLPTFGDNIGSIFGVRTLKMWPMGWTLKMGPIGCPETSVGNYHCSLLNNSDEFSSTSRRKPENTWIKKTDTVGRVAYMGERGACRVLVGKPEGKRTLGRPRRRWEDNIKVDLQERGGGMDWIELAQDVALVKAVMNPRVPYKCGEFLD